MFSVFLAETLKVRVSLNSSHTDESKYHLNPAEPIGFCGSRAVGSSAMAESNSICQYI